MNEADTNPNMEPICPQCGAPMPSGVLAGLCPTCLFKQGATADTAAPPDAAPFQPPGVEEVARLFPQLQIIALLGKGGMGAVYQARQPALDRLVALKILPAQTAAGPGFVERFNREARALARLNHPNIVAVYEFGQVNGLSFFVMEYVDGLNLREVERAGKLSAREALQIVPQICEALQYAHDEGIVHRDIKPENILLDKKGRVKIADFGIAKILGGTAETELTQTQSVVGTPHYMAPEQMEKPTSVDHRADIFSLGVVFYEMLTSELPLGKFAPPSSRKIEVDVRLDDVVLRALEKDPELRYQHVSQVKTAVDTIVGSAAPPPPGNNAAAMAREILARDYSLNIRSCVRRSWNLLKGEFWPFVGITALIMALMGFASSIGGTSLSHGENTFEIGSALGMLVAGPLMGGLLFYFLKKLRHEPATVELAFCGFSHRFLHLFLAGFATVLLTWLGFICLVLPGVYLLVAWLFTLPLVVDKQLDFWSAMELSRKVVTKHWFKFLGFGLVLCLLMVVGAMAFGFGVLVTSPLVLGALMFAYEDLFGGVTGAAAPPETAGPTGTIVMPAAAKPARPAGGPWSLATKIGLVVVVLVLVAGVSGIFLRGHRRHHVFFPQTVQVSAPGPVPVAVPDVTPPPMVFGPVLEQELQSGSRQFLNLGTQQLLELPDGIADILKDLHHERVWQTLDIPRDSRAYQYIRWLQENSVDLISDGNGKIMGFDGLFAIAHGNDSTNWDDWAALTPEQVHDAVEMVDWELRASAASTHGLAVPAPPATGVNYRSAIVLDSRDVGGPVVNLLTPDQSVNWFFKTRAGLMGVLQLVNANGSPSVTKIRYKLLQPAAEADAAGKPVANPPARERLAERLDAASSITGMADKDRTLASVVLAAAAEGEVDIAEQAAGQITEIGRRDAARRDAARTLRLRGLQKEAIEMAKGITEITVRDNTLSELAQ